MSVLILGHGREYKEINIRCSPIDLSNWYYSDYECVDSNAPIKPDYVFDLRNPNWSFTEKKYKTIIDTTGCAFYGRGQYKEKFMNSVLNALETGGAFYGRNGIILKK
jgi:hypothetical protein